MRARNANACAVLRRIISAFSCSNSDSLSTSSRLGRPLLAAPRIRATHSTLVRDENNSMNL
jgi:hypothetical protein